MPTSSVTRPKNRYAHYKRYPTAEWLADKGQLRLDAEQQLRRVAELRRALEGK